MASSPVPLPLALTQVSTSRLDCLRSSLGPSAQGQYLAKDRLHHVGR